MRPGRWGEPTQMPTPVSSSGIEAFEVVTVNADKTVNLRNRASRATYTQVPALIAGWTPSKGDLVLAAALGANVQRPAIITVQRSKVAFGS
jgi:hypothetical protein